MSVSTLESPDGRTVVAIDLDLGGRLVSLRRDGLELIYSSPTGDPMLTGCYPMAPWAGRVRHGVFHVGGHRYELPRDAPPHAIHGVVHDVEWFGVDAATFSTEFDERWPLGGGATQTIAISDDEVACELTVTAGDRPMPSVLGYHPCFVRRPSGAGAVELGFSPQWMWRRDAEGIATSEQVSPSARPWDDAFGGVIEPPQLSWPGGPTVELVSDAATWIVFDELDDVICVEPQTAPPDAFNSAPELVPAGDQRTLRLSFRWV